MEDKIEIIDDEEGRPRKLTEVITVEKQGENTVVDELIIDYETEVQTKRVTELDSETGEVIDI